MGFRIDGPHVVSFLEFARRRHPHASGFFNLSDGEKRDLLLRFEAILPRQLLQNNRHLHFLVRQGFRRFMEDGYGAVDTRRHLFRTPAREQDALAIYKAAPLKGLLLYTSQDQEFIRYVRDYWQALDLEAGSNFHFFDYGMPEYFVIDGTDPTKAYSYSEEYVRSLYPIPGAELDSLRVSSLPGCLVWDDYGRTKFFSFAREQHNPALMRERFRFIFSLDSKLDLHLPSVQQIEMTTQGAGEAQDLFVSYQHDDTNWVREMVKVLERRGYSTWFDRKLNIGEQFDLRIQEMIEKAKAVIVVWSNTAIHSKWVNAEAGFAYDRDAIVPVFKDFPLELRVPFNSVLTQNLSTWDPSSDLPAELEIALNRKFQRSQM